MSEIFQHDLDQRDWSAKHTRLKFQMVLSVVLLLVLKNYEPSGINLLIFRFEEGLPIELLRTAIFIFCLYSFFSFLSRSIHEWPKGRLLDIYSIEILRDVKSLLEEGQSLLSPIAVKYAVEKLPQMLPENRNEKSDFDDSIEGLRGRFQKVIGVHDEARILLGASGLKETSLYKAVDHSHNEMSLLEDDWPKYLSLNSQPDATKRELVLGRSTKISGTVLRNVDSVLSENVRRSISGFLEIWAFGVIFPVVTFISLLFFGDNILNFIRLVS